MSNPHRLKVPTKGMSSHLDLTLLSTRKSSSSGMSNVEDRRQRYCLRSCRNDTFVVCYCSCCHWPGDCSVFNTVHGNVAIRAHQTMGVTRYINSIRGRCTKFIVVSSRFTIIIGAFLAPRKWGHVFGAGGHDRYREQLTTKKLEVVPKYKSFFMFVSATQNAGQEF